MSTRYVPPAPESPTTDARSWLLRHARWVVLVVAVLLCAGYLLGWAAWVGPRAGEARWLGPTGPTATSKENVTLTVLGVHRVTTLVDPYTGLETTPADGLALVDVELEATSPVELASALTCRPHLVDGDHREWEASYEHVDDDAGRTRPNDCAGVEPVGPTPTRYWLRYKVPARHADRVVGVAIDLGNNHLQVIAP